MIPSCAGLDVAQALPIYSYRRALVFEDESQGSEVEEGGVGGRRDGGV